MRIVAQRVSRASVTIGGKLKSEIGKGTRHFDCCLCGKRSYGLANDAYPVVKAPCGLKTMCCNDCETNIVIPARYEELRSGRYGVNK